MNKELFQKYLAVKAFYETPAVKKRLESEDTVRGAFELAYFDMQRTLKGIGKNPNNNNIKQKVFEIIYQFYDDVSKNFEFYSLRDYDGSIGIIFNEIISSSAELGHKFTVGQAQKVTNMFFKYMLLVDERLNIHLNYFHVPFDSVILNGLMSKEYSAEIRTYAKECTPWSKMKDFKHYMELQDALRDLYEYPIIFEFDVWNKWKP